MISLVIGLGGILFYPIKEIRRCFEKPYTQL